MRDISTFKQLMSASGQRYFVGELAGVMVGLVPTNSRDEHGNPVWRLVAKDPKTSVKSRSAELLKGGCLLVRLTEPPHTPTRSRRKREKRA
jgi:hypothetical protein